MKNIIFSIGISICFLQSVVNAEGLNTDTKNSTREQVSEHIIKLQGGRLGKLLDYAGKPKSEGVLNCLCRATGRGGVGGGVHYKPGYPCEAIGVLGGHSGPIGFPSDPSSLNYCHYDDDSTIVDVVENALKSELANVVKPNPSAIKVPTKKECMRRSDNAIAKKRVTQELEAAEWFRSQGKSVLPPPDDPEYKKQLAEIKQLQQSSNQKLWTKAQNAKKTIKENMALQSANAIQDNKAAFDTSVDLVLGLLEIQHSELLAQKKKIEADYKDTAKRYKASGDRTLLNTRDRLREEYAETKTRIERAKKSKTSMTGLKKAFDTTKHLDDARAAYIKFQKGNNADGMIEATKLFDTYLTQYSQYVTKGSDEYVAKLRKLGAGPKAIEALTKSKQTTARRISEMSSGVKKSLDIVDKAKKAYAIYQKFEAIQAESNRLFETGKFSESSLKMYKAFAILGQGTQIASEYFPPGVKEAAQYYAGIVLLPVKLDERIKKVLDRMDYGANLYGSLQQSPAMKAYKGPPLVRDPYLYRKGGLGVYVDDTSVPNRYFALTSPDKKMIEMTKKHFDEVKKLAYYYSLANGKKMTNSQLQGILTGDLKMSKGVSFASLARLKKEAKSAKEEAAELNALRKQLGRNDITPKEIQSWKRWKKMLLKFTQTCPLTAERESKLYASFKSNPVKVQAVLLARLRKIDERK